MNVLNEVVAKANENLKEQTPVCIISYTLISVLALWIVNQFVSKGPKKIFQELISFAMSFLKKLPGAQGAIAKEQEKMLEKIRGAFPTIKSEGFNYKLPENGVPSDELLERLKKMKQEEHTKLMGGKMSGVVYMGDQEHEKLLLDSYSMFFHVNPLHPEIFPSGRKFESEIIRMTIDMMRGDDNCCGAVTSGGTESILMALKAYRDRARVERPYIDVPEAIIPVTAHAAFNKGCHYFGIKLVPIAVDQDTFMVNPKHVRKAITRNTICIIGSAPNFPQGTIDPISDLAKIAVEYDIGLHVDCCLGGFVLPFAREFREFSIPDFDFSLKGVSSISADTHKFGLASKGSSVIMFNSRKLRSYMFFVCESWTGGIYMSPTIAGSRPGGLLATAWTSMMHIGRKGFLDISKKIVDTSRRIREGIKTIEDIKLMGDPLAMVVAFTSANRSINIFMVNDAMSELGWSLNVLQHPEGIHMCVTANNVGKGDQFVDDLRKAVNLVKENPKKFANGMAPVYGAAISVPDRSIVTDLVSCVGDVLLDMPPKKNHHPNE